MNYIVNSNLKKEELLFYNNEVQLYIDQNDLINAIEEANEDYVRQYQDLSKYKAPIIKNIPLKNLSGSIGEGLCKILSDRWKTITKNPHEAGSPDFIPTVSSSENWTKNPTAKYYPHGGFDTKASYCQDKKFVRVKASSHHDQTTTVLVVQWYLNEKNIPEIIGVFYTNKLTKNDWKISKGRVGSKTTNAATLTKSGVEKLRYGWIVLNKNVQLPTQKKILVQYGL
jgi:hypothetical protein